MKVVLASNNLGKIREFNALLKNYSINLVPQAELGVEEVEETGLSFIENALIKARHAARITGLPTIADDSGLSVPVLNGAPGIHSARYAGIHATAQDNIHKLLNELNTFSETERKAVFYCTLVFMSHSNDPIPLVCNGTWPGIILHTTQGENGFGYDPIFYVPSEKKTAAELLPERKNKISHRGMALQSLLKMLPDKI
ncbi:MAG: RdgB/HAM1 family non-canonical purine NTP pyrophosphatase [Gammaproteobacteria bacterium]|nr:RdgB/HAM1 family non-canonical purine NTP pyrophosphatase [Gammaproteobacteria bacterium]MCW5583725.1 RdgB/HAM1 family non-canonical purine NTP pyrophosphatase [Gammaproteobacteria bacterium]